MNNDERNGSSANQSGEGGGSSNGSDDSMTIRCPQCKTAFQVTLRAAEAAMSVKCPRGHEVPLVKGLG